MLTEAKFKQHFKVVKNRADGNCLFESMEYLLDGTLYALKNGGAPTARQIRAMVSRFYRKFDLAADYKETTIEYAIKLGNMFDNYDENIDGTQFHHDHNIRNDKVWASMTDVLICCILFKININLYKYAPATKTYHLEKIESQYNYHQTVNLFYNGRDHFEAMDYRV